ncbi:MAG: hypothetical protein OXI79_08715 [Gammaproteobacteria bacterium]|nr:hypothetical protein [Gammaproteobacteria bacterium]
MESRRGLSLTALLILCATFLAASCGLEEDTEEAARSLFHSIENFLPFLGFVLFGLLCFRMIEAIQLSNIRKELARLTKTLGELFRPPTPNGGVEADADAASLEDDDTRFRPDTG